MWICLDLVRLSGYSLGGNSLVLPATSTKGQRANIGSEFADKEGVEIQLFALSNKAKKKLKTRRLIFNWNLEDK